MIGGADSSRRGITAGSTFSKAKLWWLLLLGGVANTTVATNTTLAAPMIPTSYDERVAQHNQLILNRTLDERDAYTQVIRAYFQLPLDEEPLQDLLDKVGPSSSNSDFGIVVLVRILFFTGRGNMSAYYDNLIRPTLMSEQYWYSTDNQVLNDDTMNSENHMILWMSSSWLLRERYSDWAATNNDATLRQRLTHFLKLKIDYGYYEFLSITYLPLTLGGLLNLVDFAVDAEIRQLADGALRRLVADYLLFVTDKGIHFTVAGRDYAERFSSRPYSAPMDGIVYLLLGYGVPWITSQTDFIHFLTTSSMRFTNELAAWTLSLDTTYTYGHTLAESFAINAPLDKYDRIVFQFSQGGYAHPSTIGDTVDFIRHFGPIKFSSGVTLDGTFIPTRLQDRGSDIAVLLKQLTYGTVNSGNTVRVYRQAGCMLTSVPDFWPGFVGGQNFPWMAVVDEIPVWTQSGRVQRRWLDKSGFIANTHLPMIVQQGNAALIVYKPNKPMPLSIWSDVALHFRETKFDEIKTVKIREGSGIGGFFGSLLASTVNALTKGTWRRGSWILGRRRDSYIAVYRPCGAKKQKGWYACSGASGRQVWAVVVGDATRYGTFDAFANVIQESRVDEEYRRRRRLVGKKPLYITSLTVEDSHLRNEW